MTAELISQPAATRGTMRAGRMSKYSRPQAATRNPTSDAQLHELWESMTDVLHAIESPASALLCTTSGAPVAAYGRSGTDLPRASRRVGQVFAARTSTESLDHDGTPCAVETLELASGQQHTVIASVPGAPDGDHLLSVTAVGVSRPLLLAWTRLVAEDLRQQMTDQLVPRSSSAAV